MMPNLSSGETTSIPRVVSILMLRAAVFGTFMVGIGILFLGGPAFTVESVRTSPFLWLMDTLGYATEVEPVTGRSSTGNFALITVITLITWIYTLLKTYVEILKIIGFLYDQYRIITNREIVRAAWGE
ncbi:hypothetical protein RYH80_18135 [Halobaculum sp. MBLA0147]|uniref:hypothetical protein n=1 Tax=Halobaculum sp. MBLA0147 TaxID=3079934 RepID=UPI003525570C